MLVELTVATLIGGVLIRYLLGAVGLVNGDWATSFVAALVGSLAATFGALGIAYVAASATGSFGLTLVVAFVAGLAILAAVIRGIARYEGDGGQPTWGASFGVALIYRIVVAILQAVLG